MQCVFSLTRLSYRDQYSILAETISREKEALQIREKAQEKVYNKERCEVLVRGLVRKGFNSWQFSTLC